MLAAGLLGESQAAEVTLATVRPQTPTRVVLHFSETLEPASAEMASNYTINGVQIENATLSEGGKVVVLTTAALAEQAEYNLTVSTNVRNADGSAAVAANTETTFRGPVFRLGVVYVEFYNDIPGNQVSTMLDDPDFPDSPDEVVFIPRFELPYGPGPAPEIRGDRYGARAVAFVEAEATGEYVFYLTGIDDAGWLYVSSEGEDPESAELLIDDAVCCEQTFVGGPVTLETGKRYYIEVLFKENTGGDHLEVKASDLTFVGDPGELPILGGESSPLRIGSYVEGVERKPEIVEQPQPDTVTVGERATFSALATSDFGLAFYQWLRDGEPIEDATGTSYTTEATSAADDGALFSVEVRNLDGAVTSESAELTVAPDQTLPVLTAAAANLAPTIIQVFSNKELDPDTAQTAGNYTLEGQTVASAVLSANAKQVTLTLDSALEADSVYTLRVNGVADTSEPPNVLMNAEVTVLVRHQTPPEFGTTVNGFQDDFVGTERDPGWAVATPGSMPADVFQLENVDGLGVLSVSTPDSPRDPNHLIYTGAAYSPNTQEVLARIRVTLWNGARGGVSGAVSASNSRGWNFFFQEGGKVVFLNDQVAFSDEFEFPWENNVWYWMRLKVMPPMEGQPNVFGKIWAADIITPEPADWTGEWESGSRSGYAGIGSPVHPEAGGNLEVDYILIMAEGLPPIEPDAESVPEVFIPPVLVRPAEFEQVVRGFQDDFTAPARGAGWAVSPPNIPERDVFEVTMADGLGVLAVGTPAAPADPNHLVYVGAEYSTTTQEVLARIRVTTWNGARGGVSATVSPSNSRGINFFFQEGQKVVFLNDQAAFSDEYDFPWENNEWYWMRLRVLPPDGENPNVFGKIWPADNATEEPEEWTAEWVATARTGRAGVASPVHPESWGTLEVDYILIMAAELPEIAPQAEVFQEPTPMLSIERLENGMFLIHFSNGVLQSSASLNPVDWNNVEEATSPFLVDPAGEMQFYRVSSP